MIFAKNNNLNFAVVVKLLGMLLLIEAAFMLPSAIVSFAYHETAAMWSFIYSIAIQILCISFDCDVRIAYKICISIIEIPLIIFFHSP